MPAAITTAAPKFEVGPAFPYRRGCENAAKQHLMDGAFAAWLGDHNGRWGAFDRNGVCRRAAFHAKADAEAWIAHERNRLAQFLDAEARS